MKERIAGPLPLLVLAGALVAGCGAPAPPATTGPEGDSRTAEEKASEDLILKSRNVNNKNAKR